MGKLDGKVAIITGASQGMGAAHVKAFINEGAKVLITDVNEEKGEALAKELGDNARFFKLDVTSEESWQAAADFAVKEFGTVDILVNNAGITKVISVLDITKEQYDLIYKINQLGVLFGIKTIGKIMKENGGGSIVNISSLNGLIAGAIGYTDTKFAVRGMTKAAALELSRYGIRVNSVHPGAIDTPMIHQGDTDDAVKALEKTIPLGRVGQPEEVSKMILFLASDDSAYSTGSEFIVDGGLSFK